MRHRELGGFNQALHGCLRQGEFDFALPVIEVREVDSRERGEREAAAAGAHQHAIAFQLHGNLCPFRQATADIKELTRWNSGSARFVRLRKRHACDHFHLEIGAGQRQRAVCDL